MVFSLFIATALSITAVPVIAKVLIDLNLIRRNIGQITLASGMTDDTVGWILLSVVSGLAHSGEFDIVSAMGSGMNARGAMEIIVATIGLSLGVLNLQMYSIIVMVAIITSLMAPPLLRLTLAKVEIGKEEATRLKQEEFANRSFVKQIKRVLIPTRGGSNVQIAAQMVSHLAHQNPLEITALYVNNQARHRQRDRKKLPLAPVTNPQAESALTAIEQEV